MELSFFTISASAWGGGRRGGAKFVTIGASGGRGGAEFVTISANEGGVEQSLLQLVLVGEGWSRVCYN